MILEQYVGEALVALISVITGWAIGLKRQRVDTKKIEVEVLEKSLQVMQKDVVEPLRASLGIVQNHYSELSKNFDTLKNAVNKMYNCRSLSNCPIRVELQKSDKNNGNRKARNGKPPTNRQREPSGRENDSPGDSTADDGEDQPNA